LALVAFSIGFNTVRYPMVWEMIGPARASEKELSSALPRPAEPASRPPASPPRKAPPPRPAEPIAVKPAPVVARKPKAEKPRPPAAKPESGKAAADKKPAASDNVASTAPQPQKPLVPVTQVRLASAPANGTAIGTVIRRLPPVESADSNAINRAALPAGGSIPVYPTTGIE
jgi:hypothetical protein